MGYSKNGRIYDDSGNITGAYIEEFPDDEPEPLNPEILVNQQRFLALDAESQERYSWDQVESCFPQRIAHFENADVFLEYKAKAAWLGASPAVALRRYLTEQKRVLAATQQYMKRF